MGLLVEMSRERMSGGMDPGKEGSESSIRYAASPAT